MTQTSALPKLPTVLASNMIYAQGWSPTAEELAAIKARADFFEAEGMSREVHIRVLDVYTNAKIGTLIYSA